MAAASAPASAPASATLVRMGKLVATRSMCAVAGVGVAATTARHANYTTQHHYKVNCFRVIIAAHAPDRTAPHRPFARCAIFVVRCTALFAMLRPVRADGGYYINLGQNAKLFSREKHRSVSSALYRVHGNALRARPI